MTYLTPSFNSEELEVYGINDPFLTPEQKESLKFTETRVNQQLDWLAQLLGWNGPNYWGNLVSNVAQKRNLLTGTFGIYSGYLYPKVKEIRNWNHSVVIASDDRIEPGLTFYLGDYTYELKGVEVDGEDYILDFGELSSQFYSDIAASNQLKTIVRSSLPDPFHRDKAKGSSDVTLMVSPDEGTGELTFEVETGINLKLPVVNKVFFEGSRLYLNLPLTLTIENKLNSEQIYSKASSYDFDSEKWYLDVPIGYSDSKVSLSYGSYTTTISLIKWSFDGGWGEQNVIENYTGTWSNKGGKLPFHFAFDSLGLHGCNPEKAVSMEPLNIELPFNRLLNLIYYQKASVSANPPPQEGPENQVWWNSSSGALSVYSGSSFNCGPWTEINYPDSPENGPVPAYIFPDVDSFHNYTSPIGPDLTVVIYDGNGLGVSDNIFNLTGTVDVPCKVEMSKNEEGIWQLLYMEVNLKDDFYQVATILPGKFPVKLKDSSGLTPSYGDLTIKNLSSTLSMPYPVTLSKDESQGVNEWYISPPSSLKYIGNTKLYDNGSLEGGQLYLDYGNLNQESRASFIFYYSRWEKEGGNWELKGDWIPLNDNVTSSAPNPVVNYGAIKVYCNSTELTQGEEYRTSDFSITYDAQNGNFSFSYLPLSYKGMVELPAISISDSLTTTFRHDISSSVYSGAVYKLNPNPIDTNTPLRVWKSDPLFVIDPDSYGYGVENPNTMVADSNSGPSDNNWERYFIRLSPLYGRNEGSWQKVSAVCQSFGLWGSPLSYERMDGPAQEETVGIFEDVVLFEDAHKHKGTVYSEPYLYSNVKLSKTYNEDFENSSLVPSFEVQNDGFEEAHIDDYDPLSYRRCSPEGEWEGIYAKVEECLEISGEIQSDLDSGSLREVDGPIWDSSVYKLPPLNATEESSTYVDSNHYKISYAFFAADLSTAEEPVFDVL